MNNCELFFKNKINLNYVDVSNGEHRLLILSQGRMGIAKLELARLAGYKRSGSELASQHWKDFAGCWLNCRLVRLAHVISS